MRLLGRVMLSKSDHSGFESHLAHMKITQNLVFVDVEASGGITPATGKMTEFGAVHYNTRLTYYGKLWDAIPSEENPAVSTIVGKGYPEYPVMAGFASWLKQFQGRPIFVSDNNGYDFMWIAYYFDKNLGENPFGHSSRRISDFWAGLKGDWTNTQKWKQYRVTPHTHNPVDDAMGNVEAFQTIITQHTSPPESNRGATST